MPIEDVDYLIQHSSEESTTIFVDSGTRDRTHYPFPSEYVVDIQEPVRDVFGFDVLDAVMPNTIYNVDNQNNGIRMLVVDVDGSSASVNSDDALGVELGKLGFASPILTWIADVGSTYHIAVVSSSYRIPSNASATPAVYASTDLYFALVENRLSSGLLLVVPSSTPPEGEPSIVYCSTKFIAANAASRTALKAALTVMGSSSFSLVRSGSDAQPQAVVGTTATYDIVTYSPAALSTSQFTSIVASASRPRLLFTASSAFIEIGFYNSPTSLQTSVQAALDSSLVGAAITVESTSNSGINRQSLFKFVAPASKRLLLCPDVSTARSVLGFDTVSGSVAGRASAVLRFGGATEPMFASIVDDAIGQVLIAPGLINLLGVRYVTLRCAEIEQYMGNVGKYGPFSTGIGVFKLLGSNEVAQLRFDYVSLIRRPLHPIGRLRRLTLRFELPDGTLFDFKGINHQILFTIKYYIPDPRVRGRAGYGERDRDSEPGSRRYVLNPDYDPDFMRFMIRRDAYAARLNDIGFAEPDQADDDDDEEDAEDEADADIAGRTSAMMRLNDYVFGRPAKVTAPFIRFGADQQNRVLESERRVLSRMGSSR